MSQFINNLFTFNCHLIWISPKLLPNLFLYFRTMTKPNYSFCLKRWVKSSDVSNFHIK